MSLSDSDIEAIAERVAAKLRAAPPAPANDPHQVVSAAQAMVMLGVRSSSALQRRLHDLGIRQVARGSYRRGDIQNAVLRRTAAPKPAIQRKAVA